ncbi:MAG: peptidase MA family metallohydrolase [Planctomycetota bacterium]|jgi:Tfp pilus assembly protein PilF
MRSLLIPVAIASTLASQAQVELLPEFIRSTIEAEYLTADERRDLRVFHTVWTGEDLENPHAQASAALAVSAWDHPVLEDERIDPQIRAAAMLSRGDIEQGLALLEGDESMRASRLRSEAYWDHGRYQDLLEETDRMILRTRQSDFDRVEDVVDAVRVMQLRARISGSDAGSFQQLMGMLARARDIMDRTYWPTWQVEASLLIEKDNRANGAEAIQQGATMAPRSAELLGLQAHLSVGGFQFDALDQIASGLNEAHSALYTDAIERRNPIASLEQARGWMRQREAQNALELLDDVLARFPNHPEARALRIAAVSLEYDFDRVDELLSEFDAFAPDSALALHEVGAVLSEARQYAEADRYLELASQRLPAWSDPLVERGLMLLQWGKDVEARDVLRLAHERDPFHVRADNSLRLVEELLTYDTVESEHFIVRFKPGIDRVMAEEMLGPLERIHEHVAGLFDHEPRERTVIELMPDHEWFAVRITGMSDIHTIAAATGSVIAMEVPKIGPDHFGEYDWARVVQHEYTHTVTLSKTRNRIPHWFTEAAAVYAEGHPRDADTVRMLTGRLLSDALFDMREINIAFVRPRRPDDRGFAYAQGHWMYEFIIERFGDSTPLRMMDLYAQGVPENQTMLDVLGVTQSEFHEMFVEWAWDQAREWGMVVEPSVALLRFRETLSDDSRADGLIDALDRFATSASRAGAMGGAVQTQSLDMVELDLATIERLVEEHPSHAELLQRGAQLAHQENGDELSQEAARWLSRYSRARPSDDTPHRVLARHYLESDRTADLRRAREHLEYLDLREQYSAIYARELARVSMRLGDLESSWRSALRATQIAPFDASNRELAATVALQRRDFESAEHHLTVLAEIEPGRDRHKQRLEALKRLRETSQ